MELNDTLRVPLAPAVVRDALEDIALLRASFDHCESFAKLARGEFALTITVPLGPLAELPARQIENALREWADDFFREFCAVVQAKHGLAPNRARSAAPRRQHVFLRPASLMAATKRSLPPHLGSAFAGRAAGALHHRGSGALPVWAWAAMIVFVALLLYATRWIGVG
jgi:hypothetical protein